MICHKVRCMFQVKNSINKIISTSLLKIKVWFCKIQEHHKVKVKSQLISEVAAMQLEDHQEVLKRAAKSNSQCNSISLRCN